jgi:S-DNA-T family DNA segregation ATPase FtsK/SpoIIIE
MLRLPRRRRTTSHGATGGVSMYDPVHLGIDEAGHPVTVTLAERNALLGGEPGGGKSSALNTIVAHAALSADCRLVLIDGKQVEFGLWRQVTDQFVGPDPAAAIACLHRLQAEMDARYDALLAAGLRKVARGSAVPLVMLAIDEVAYFSATVGEAKQQKEFSILLRDIVARGRAAGIITVAATQRPSADIIPTSLRDLFAYRWAFRCTTEASSDTILGHGWANRGYCATDIDPKARGVGWLLAEGGIPQRVKAAYLDDDQIRYLAGVAALLRRQPESSGGEVA